LSLQGALRASDQISELGCAPVGEDPKAFVDRGGLRRLETEAADAANRRVRETAYPLIFKLFGSEMPRGKERKRVLARLGEDMARIEKTVPVVGDAHPIRWCLTVESTLSGAPSLIWINAK
jgi:hypothetical protein